MHEWELCFAEACDFRTGWYLRRLLISATMYDRLADALSIQEGFGDNILLLCLYSDWPRGHSVHLCIFFLYMLYPIDFTLHKLPTSEILAFLKYWFFPASFASICLDSG
jgi:hypothetical protein